MANIGKLYRGYKAIGKPQKVNVRTLSSRTLEQRVSYYHYHLTISKTIL
jgi:hypothetical protein